MQRILYFSDTLIFLRARIYFDKFKFVLLFFFQIIPTEFDRVERSARVSDSWKKEKKKQLVVFQRVQCTDINFYSLARKCVNRRHSDIVITIVPRRNLKIYHYVNSFQDRDFSKFGTGCSKSGRNSSIDPPTIPFSRVIYSKFRSTCQMQRIDHSRVKFVSLPPQLKMHRKYTLWINDARGQRETISSAPEIPASLPHYGSIVGYNRRFFLNEQYRPKIYRLDFEIEVSHERECAKLVRDNLIQIHD